MKVVMTAPAEFDCIDCGRHIVMYRGAPGILRCSTCAWVVDNIPTEERAVIREQLGIPLISLGDD